MRLFVLVFALSFFSGVSVFSAYSSLEPEQRKQFNELLDAAFNSYVSEDYNKAMQFFQKALQMDPKDKTALKGFAECKEKVDRNRGEKIKLQKRVVDMAKKSIRNEEWLEAVDHIYEVLSVTPNHAEALSLKNEIEILVRSKMAETPIESAEYLIYQGVYFYANKRYAEALRIWKDASTMVRDQVKLSIYLEKADQRYKQSQQYEVMTVGRQRARAAFEAENYQEAVALWKKILELSPQDEEAGQELKKAQGLLTKKSKENLLGEYYDKGLSLFLEGNFIESLKYWENILSISPENEVAKDYIRKIKSKGGQTPVPAETTKESQAKSNEPKKGEKSNGKVLPKDIEDLPVNIYKKSVALYETGEYQNAIESFETLLKKNPDDQQAIEWIAKIKKERVAKAEEHYQKGLVLYSKSEMDKAIKEWQIALQIYPEHVASNRTLMKVKGDTK